MNGDTLKAMKHAMLMLEKLKELDEEQLGLLMTHFTQQGTYARAAMHETLSAQMHLFALLIHMQVIEETCV